MIELEQNVALVRQELDAAAAGRPYTLLAATKMQSVETINALPKYGIFDFGENRVQEWVEKSHKIDTNLVYHHIGRLQKNKIKYIIKEIHMVHSVDDFALAQAIDKQAAAIGRTVHVLLQVNPAGEEQKGGVSPDMLPRLVDEVQGLSNLKLRGLMCMAPYTNDEYTIRSCFAKARQLFEGLGGEGIDTLSMGMSHDAAYALQEGSTLVRIGSRLFGERQY